MSRLLEGKAQRVIRSLRWQSTHLKIKGTDLENINTCSGMRWIMKGAKSMLNIRCIHLNGDWDLFVDFYIKEEQKNLYPIKAANDELFIESMVA